MNVRQSRIISFRYVGIAVLRQWVDTPIRYSTNAVMPHCCDVGIGCCGVIAFAFCGVAILSGYGVPVFRSCGNPNMT
jgi:hypothetical protein